jgi:hypothetical protein
MKQQQIEWRRIKVLELSSQGYSEREIAEQLQPLAVCTIHRDIVYLRKQAREKLQGHIHQTIPEEYQKAMNSLNQVLRMSWSIANRTEDEKTKLQALALINDVNKYRTELVTNGVIVNDALRIVQSKMEHLNGNGKGKGGEKRLLQDIKRDFPLPEPGQEEEEQLKTTNRVF